jgi:geranylgeranyl diphosphate synthase type II
VTPLELEQYLAECRLLTLAELRDIIPRETRCGSTLYDLMLDYPLRAAKGLRPALCIATCRAAGGSLEAVLRSAAALELYHNAFLIHDDVEDGSETRRSRATLHRTHGMPVAVNVGDAMLALALEPLLDNLRLVGLGKALRILQVIARMARESAEGQAIELDWIRRRRWNLTDVDYIRMVYKKSSWYTFVTPVTIAAIVAGLERERLRPLRSFAALLGIAFQIQDDVLNLVGESRQYGKEIAGDLWEGKHTLILMHAIRSASPAERARAEGILSRRRPTRDHEDDTRKRLAPLLARLAAAGELPARARDAIEGCLLAGPARPPKTLDDIQYLIGLIERHRSIDHARRVACRYARRAGDLLARTDWLRPSVHRDLLYGLVEFVTSRDR